MAGELRAELCQVFIGTIVARGSYVKYSLARFLHGIISRSYVKYLLAWFLMRTILKTK